MAEVDWESGKISPPAQAGSEPDWDSGEIKTPKPGGFVASAKQSVGSLIKGAGQAAADFIPGVSQGNAVQRYGQSVIDANPTAVHSLSDIADKPVAAVKEAAGNAAGSIGGMVGARVLGNAITAAAPLTGPAAPVTAAVGQGVAWLGPWAAAALPSFGGIREQQVKDDPSKQDSIGAKALAAAGAGTVGFIENKFGPQEWALRALSQEGRKQLAEKFAAKSLAGSVGKGVAKGAAVEGAEELAQNPIEQLASYQNPTTAENLQDTAFSGVMGALGGGVFGGGMGAASRMVGGEGSKPAPQADPAADQASPTLALPAPPPSTGTPGEQLAASDAERAAQVAQAEARAADLYQQRDQFDAARQANQAGAPIPFDRTPAEELASQRKAAMGIDPAAGPLSAGAAIAVETQAAEEVRLGAAAMLAEGAARAQQAQAERAAWEAANPGIPYEPVPPAPKNGIYVGKTALFDGFGASTGSVSDGNRRQLMVDPSGGYFWGDWRQESQRDVGAVAGGSDKDGVPASFQSGKEAREAAISTPASKTAPTSAGSFGAMNDFAELLGQERQDVSQRRAGIAERQGQRREFDLAEADRRTAESMQREAQARRRAVLDAVLADPETKNPAGRFAATLRREGYRDSTPTEDELRTIQRFEDVRAAKPAPPEVEPSAPNELDPAAMGIRERRDPAPPKNLREGMARAQAARAAEGGSMPQAAQPTAAPSFDPGKAWTSLDTKQRADLAGRLQGVPPIVSKNVPRAEWGKINPALRAKLAEAMASQAATPIEGADLGDGWAAFRPESGTVGVPRAEMPQIKAEHRGAMVNFMNARGVQHQEETVPAASLKPTQAEFSREKVARAKAFDGGSRSILVSADNHVLDGHHQWMAARDKGEDVKVIRLDAPIRDLVGLAHDFPSSTTAGGAATAEGGQDGQSLEQQADAGMASQSRAQGSADVGRGAGDLVQRPDGTAGTGVGAAAASAARGGAPAEPAGAAGGGRDAVARAAASVDDLAAMAQDAGWAEIGGRLIRDQSGMASRTKWLPRAEWFRAGMEADPNKLARDIERFAAGGKVPAKSRRTIEGMLDWLDAQRGVFTLDEDASAYDFEAAGLDDSAGQDALTLGDIFAEVAPQDEASVMRALGFTEEEIQDVVGQKADREGPRGTGQDGAGRAQEAGEVARSDAQPQGEAGSESAPEGLTDGRGERVTAEVAGTLGRGDILRDESGAEYYVWSARFGGAGSIEVVPFKDGKPVVYAGSSIRFALTPAAQEANPERRSDALFLVKRVAIEPALTSYTNEDIARQEAAQRAAATEAERTQREADQKAQADAERDTFTLTGSDRPTDVLAAQGQGGLFDAPTPANQDPIKNENRAKAGPAAETSPPDQGPIKNSEPASPSVGNAPSPLEVLFSDLNSDSTRKANKARKAAAKLPEAARIEYVQANFHDLLIQLMDAGKLEVNGATTLTEDNASCL